MGKPAETISEDYREEQQKLHKNPDYGVASIRFAPLVSGLLKAGRCESLSDYGAGKCKLREALGPAAEGIDYRPYDPAFPDYGPARPADLVTCIDVLEHIEPDHLDAVLDELQSITVRLGMFTVHTGPAKKVLSDGRNAHLTQKPPSWWRERLDSRFDILHLKPIRKGFFVVLTARDKSDDLADEVDMRALRKVVRSARPRSFWTRLKSKLKKRFAQ